MGAQSSVWVALQGARLELHKCEAGSEPMAGAKPYARVELVGAHLTMQARMRAGEGGGEGGGGGGGMGLHCRPCGRPTVGLPTRPPPQKLADFTVTPAKGPAFVFTAPSEQEREQWMVGLARVEGLHRCACVILQVGRLLAHVHAPLHTHAEPLTAAAAPAANRPPRRVGDYYVLGRAWGHGATCQVAECVGRCVAARLPCVPPPLPPFPAMRRAPAPSSRPMLARLRCCCCCCRYTGKRYALKTRVHRNATASKQMHNELHILQLCARHP